MKRFSIVFMSILFSLLLFPGSGWTALIKSDVSPPGAKGTFAADLSYFFVDDLSAALSIELTNTSVAPSAGFITALAFNNPFDRITGVTLSVTDSDFSLIGDQSFQDEIVVSPLGLFDIGASIATGAENKWLGGQNPQYGIAAGDTETFVFNLMGTGLATLDEQSFLQAFSQPSLRNGSNFAVRFRGSSTPTGTASTSAVPLPASIYLLGLGLMSLIGIRKKRAS